MIVYKNNAKEFIEDVDTNKISDLIESEYIKAFGRRVSESEKRSWNNSMQFMGKAVRRASVAESAGILIEYNLPATSKRIDFVIAGENEAGDKNFVIIELKQWEKAEKTEKEDVVNSFVGGAVRETTHPAYQATSYKLYLKDYNEAVFSGSVSAYSCAYLHNYSELDPEPLKSEVYKESLEHSPIFFKDDSEKLENFIKLHVGKGNGEKILYEVDSGQIRPSKKLIEHVASVFKGNKEFILLDEQKVAYSSALALVTNAKPDQKSVLIVKGGPGTGKSVISMNLIPGLLEEKLNAVFVAPNASFRNVMVEKLAKETTKTRLKHLFKGSGSFFDIPENTYDAIVVDEAHRLKDGSAYMYKGDNQVEDIVKSARTTIFFVDDNQIIRPDDIGSVAEIKRVSELFNAEVHELELSAQFRCSGAEGYVNWLDDVLQIQETGNFDGWNDEDFEFKIMDDPNKVFQKVKEKQENGHDARMLAGYAWRWSSQKEGNVDGDIDDVEIPEFDFRMPWNSRKTGTTWAIDPAGVDEIGCIHTSQGLEFSYVGVIVGNELRFDPETLTYYVDWDSYKDAAGKKTMKEKPEELTKLVKNIYKVLMSRGIRGCYLFFMDKDVEKYFRKRLGKEEINVIEKSNE